MVFTSPLSPYVYPPVIAFALVASIAAIPALALLFAWIAARVAGEAPAAVRSSGGVPLVGGVAGAFVAMALPGVADILGVLIAVPLGLLSLVLIVVGGALLAAPASRAALRAAIARAPGAVPPGARVVFGLALAVCCWSVATGVRLVLASASPDVPGARLLPVLAIEALPLLAIWAVGRAAMVAGAIALLRARYAGTLVYAAGFTLVVVPDLANLTAHASTLPHLAELAVQVAALLLGWRHVRPRASPALRLDPA
jgi:hypothetical protein